MILGTAFYGFFAVLLLYNLAVTNLLRGLMKCLPSK
jgi:hypothetical protein